MHYVYGLYCKDGYYIGCTDNLKERIVRHQKGHVPATIARRPIKLDFYFAINDKYKAFEFEKYLKSGSGRAFINKHLSDSRPSTNPFNSKMEANITGPLHECLDLFKRIDECYSKKDIRINCFLACLFINLRHLTFYFIDKKSPFNKYKKEFSDEESAVVHKVLNLRVASAHPEAEQRWRGEHMMITGAQIFRDKDVEIQYGLNKLFLIKDILSLFKKLRNTFIKIPELAHWGKNPSWDMDEKELLRIELSIVVMLENPEKFLIKRSFTTDPSASSVQPKVH